MIQRIYRWDLDKTYLETDIDSWRGLIRSALERPHQKRAVPGATALIRALAAQPARILFLSGSPTQMRSRLEAKLRLDGVPFEQLILKDNLRNLRKGRFRAVRGQFGYKLPMLLAGRVGVDQEVREGLFGDDAEVDALVYSVYADAVAGRLSPVELSRILEAEGSYPDHLVDALAALTRVSRVEAVDRIFIHLARARAPEDFAPLGARVVPVRTWLQAAIVLFGSGELSGEGLSKVLETSALNEHSARQQVEDILRRGGAPPETVEQLRTVGGPWAGLVQGVQVGRYRSPGPSESLDYLELLRKFRR